MPDETYDLWRGEHRLSSPRRVALDSNIASICADFRRLDAAARGRVRGSISLDDCYTLLTFSRRAAVFAMRVGPSDVTEGLTAIAMIEAERVDYRDILVALSLLHHAAARTGQDPVAAFGAMAELAEPAVADHITSFAARRPEDRNLRDAWGFYELNTDGAGLIGWGFRRYDPTHDLARPSLAVADLLEADNYQPDDPAVATELPSVWLRRPADPSLVATLRLIRAGATIWGRLRPQLDASHTSQQLTIFLVELPDEARARDLATVSREPQDGFARLGVAEGSLFCLVVARSFVQGVASFETTESLRRFGPGLAEILGNTAAPT